ncbi:MAG: T9SS type A sorting domain-containing protein [Flavobacterium sp.]|jgi:hypothetical protein|uniref:T9SS type A sorting domain-containing protein n=1 Tax=Flavobacterium sp. TaxID=239 RepID=UPI001B6E02B0|nr:T9SS type A sorting domain-containing protein [Flavobacterium sp.]MBP9848860.1 T9SS type A sorting domain-containing protein [Flavobacterium sp.]TAF11911.1 MAG: T9SS C-terminal target domain-containing protein [Flavobacteriia bacterium]WRH72212.1 MAG: T9SS type A sorting domain-containing protein [Flavobacterium sp.]
MKKLYTLLLIAVSTLSFGQILSEDFNYADGALLTANGWTAFSGAGTNALDVGTSNGLTYTGYSGTTGITGAVVGNAARLDNTGEDAQKTFTAVTSGSLYYSFLINVTDGTAGYFAGLNTTGSTFGNRLWVKPSTTVGKVNFGMSNTGTGTYGTTDFDINTTYLIIVKYDVTASGAASMWVKQAGVPANEIGAGTPEVTTTGSGSATISGFFLRQPATAQNITIDGIRIYSTWFGATPCALALAAETTTCDAITLNIDTYSVSIPFTGGGTGSYTLVASTGTVGGDNPSTTATGTITISNIPEGTNVTLSVTGACTLSKTITSPECKPINTLPLNESFPYTVGNSLNAEQKWTIVNTGDNILIEAGNLSYTGITPSGNSVSFIGTGAESRTPFTDTTSGTIYASFLAKVTDISGITVDLTSNYSALFTTNSGVSTNARVWMRKNGTQYQYGLGTAASPTDWDTNLYDTNTTQYLVLGYNFTTNSLSLFVNPTIGGSNVAPTVSVTMAAPLTSISGFMLRQEAANTTPGMTIDELTIDTTPNFTLSSSSFDNINGLTMYPNPVSGGTLNFTSAANAAMSVQIFDLLGKEVLKSNVVNNTVNVAKLTAGVYVIKITEEGKTATRKLVIK